MRWKAHENLSAKKHIYTLCSWLTRTRSIWTEENWTLIPYKWSHDTQTNISADSILKSDKHYARLDEHSSVLYETKSFIFRFSSIRFQWPATICVHCHLSSYYFNFSCLSSLSNVFEATPLLIISNLSDVFALKLN